MGFLKALKRLLDRRDDVSIIASINSRRLFLPRKLADSITGSAHERLDTPDEEPAELLPDAEIDRNAPKDVLRAREDALSRERGRRRSSRRDR